MDGSVNEGALADKEQGSQRFEALQKFEKLVVSVPVWLAGGVKQIYLIKAEQNRLLGGTLEIFA
jgi:hypothetical protein